MTRRLLLLAVLSVRAAFAADAARDAASVITQLAAALTAGNPGEFMAPFDRACPGYQRLRDNVAALTAQGDTQSYIDVVSNQGNDTRRNLELDWELRIQRSGDATISARRQVRVECTLEKRRGRWRIVRFAPAGFLAP